MVLKRKTVEERLEAIEAKLDLLEGMDERTSKMVESKVFELRALSYFILIIVSVMLALAIGALLKLLGV